MIMVENMLIISTNISTVTSENIGNLKVRRSSIGSFIFSWRHTKNSKLMAPAAMHHITFGSDQVPSPAR